MTTKTAKPKNKTMVYCTDDNSKVKGTIVCKTETELVVDLPTGFQMTLHKLSPKRLYIWRVGTLEFVSDGWEQS